MSNYFVFWKQYYSKITGLIRDILYDLHTTYEREKKRSVGSGEKVDEIQIKEMEQHIFHIIMNIE